MLYFKIILLVIVLSFSGQDVFAKAIPHLSSLERSSLRYHLENLYNEMNLLVKNQRVDLADLKRQEREMSVFKIFERIPFTREIESLKNQLTQSAQEAGFEVVKFEVTHFTPPARKLPEKIYSSDSSFRISTDQLVEKIFFRLKVKGAPEKVNAWIQKWIDHPLRLVELDQPNHLRSALVSQGPKQWIVNAHAFRFRDITYPTLVPKNPRDYLPVWAKKNPDRFSKEEPILWKFVSGIEELAPKTPPFYQTRTRFNLNDARYSFFISKVVGPLSRNK